MGLGMCGVGCDSFESRARIETHQTPTQAPESPLPGMPKKRPQSALTWASLGHFPARVHIGAPLSSHTTAPLGHPVENGGPGLSCIEKVFACQMERAGKADCQGERAGAHHTVVPNPFRTSYFLHKKEHTVTPSKLLRRKSMPTPVARVCFLATLFLVACSIAHADNNSPGPPRNNPSTIPLQGARTPVPIGGRSADLSTGRGRNSQQDDRLVAAIASAQVSPSPQGGVVGALPSRLEGANAGGSSQGGLSRFGSSSGGLNDPIEAFPTETRTAPIDVSKKLNTAIRNSDIAGAVELLTREDDVHELARGLKFNGSNRQELIKKTASRMPDGDVIAMKSIAKAVLDTRDARKFAMVMVLSTLDERREDLERKLVQLLRNRDLMHAILFADPVNQFVPDDGKSSTRIRQSDKSGLTNGDSGQFMLGGRGRRRSICNGCSPENSYVCVHCWAKDVCAEFEWCPKN